MLDFNSVSTLFVAVPKGARLGAPLALMVETQAIGRGVITLNMER